MASDLRGAVSSVWTKAATNVASTWSAAAGGAGETNAMALNLYKRLSRRQFENGDEFLTEYDALKSSQRRAFVAMVNSDSKARTEASLLGVWVVRELVEDGVTAMTSFECLRVLFEPTGAFNIRSIPIMLRAPRPKEQSQWKDFVAKWKADMACMWTLLNHAMSTPDRREASKPLIENMFTSIDKPEIMWFHLALFHMLIELDYFVDDQSFKKLLSGNILDRDNKSNQSRSDYLRCLHIKYPLRLPKLAVLFTKPASNVDFYNVAELLVLTGCGSDLAKHAMNIMKFKPEQKQLMALQIPATQIQLAVYCLLCGDIPAMMAFNLFFGPTMLAFQTTVGLTEKVRTGKIQPSQQHVAAMADFLIMNVRPDIRLLVMKDLLGMFPKAMENYIGQFNERNMILSGVNMPGETLKELFVNNAQTRPPYSKFSE